MTSFRTTIIGLWPTPGSLMNERYLSAHWTIWPWPSFTFRIRGDANALKLTVFEDLPEIFDDFGGFKRHFRIRFDGDVARLDVEKCLFNSFGDCPIGSATLP